MTNHVQTYEPKLVSAEKQREDIRRMISDAVRPVETGWLPPCWRGGLA